jgi:hypothetical protein
MQEQLALIAGTCLVGALLGGCAGAPRLETVTERLSPGGAAASACLQACADALRACQQACEADYRDCLARVEPGVNEHYRQALERHAQALERYRRTLTDYRFDFWLGWYGDSGGFAYHPWAWGPYWGAPSWSYAPPPPVPAYEEVATAYRQAQCGADCGCQTADDACFRGCGGRIETRSRCVENCPQEGAVPE